MEKFPSELELIAASALLFLPIAVLSEKRKSENDFNNDPIDVASTCEESEVGKDKSITSDSNSTDSSWLTSDGSSGAVQVKRMKLMSAFTPKLKDLRRRRSKIQRSFHGRKLASRTSKKTAALVSFQNVSETASEASCMSSSRSDLSSAQSRKDERSPAATTEAELKRRESISCNIRQRAGDILNFLSRGCSSEVRIRQVLGDSPDTSKALRILLKRAEIKRSGAGGRSDPYIYTISAGQKKDHADWSNPWIEY